MLLIFIRTYIMKRLISMILLCALVQVSFAKTPQFNDYPVKAYNGKPAKILLNNEKAKTYKTRLSSALSQKPVFAGEYVLVSWGCGMGCESHHFVNKRTGQVVEKGFGGEMDIDDIQQYKLNSNLLIAGGSEFDENYNEIGTFTNYYLMKNSKLELIKTLRNK